MSTTKNKTIFDVSQYVRPMVMQLKPYSSARDEFYEVSEDYIFLDANESPFANHFNRYPDPKQGELKSALSELKGINPQNIFIGNGSDEALDVLMRAFCEPNQDNIITLPPTYGMYGVLANINAVENRELVLNELFEPNVDAIMEACDANSKVLFLCSPNNPTGNVFPDESIVKLLQNFPGLVVIDEAYIDFSTSESWLTELDDYPNLVIIQTLSKAYGLAGLRIGVLYASAEIVSIVDRIKPPYNLNTFSQQTAVKKIRHNTIPSQVKKIIQEREKLIEYLERLSWVKKIYPSDANFILIKVDDASVRYQQLLEKNIVVRNRSNQPLCENCLRISIGTREETIQLIQSLKSL
jgi:histidinol-phosphate aminotransferase